MIIVRYKPHRTYVSTTATLNLGGIRILFLTLYLFFNHFNSINGRDDSTESPTRKQYNTNTGTLS